LGVRRGHSSGEYADWPLRKPTDWSQPSFESALQLIQRTATVVLEGPGFFSDGFSWYLSALLEVYHARTTLLRTGKPGRPKHSLTEPHADLVYGQVVKKQRKGYLKELVFRLLCGPKRLEVLGLSIRTSLIKRLNLTLRHTLAPLVRQSWSCCIDRTQMRRRVMLFQALFGLFESCRRPNLSR
jgi:hypothetical protein